MIHTLAEFERIATTGGNITGDDVVRMHNLVDRYALDLGRAYKAKADSLLKRQPVGPRMAVVIGAVARVVGKEMALPVGDRA